MIVLVDTNILLDVTQRREKFYESALGIWALVETGEIAGYISAISFNNLFYVAQKTAGREQALKAVRQLRQIFRIVPLDEVIIDLAIESPGHDFEDAIQAASALRIQAQYIISRDEKDFISSGVPALTAEAFLALLKS